MGPVYVYLIQTEAFIEMGPELGGERRLQVLQAARVFRRNESRPDRAEGNLHVHGSMPGRAEGALYVQPTCLDMQRVLCTVKLSRKSIY